MNYSEYKSCCEKVFAEPLEMIAEFKEDTFVESSDQFSGQVFMTLNHQLQEKIQYLLSFTAKFKDEKILEFRMDSEYEWSTINFFMEPMADVLNDFKFSVD